MKPYWGLRSYGTEPQVWGGENCEHEWASETVPPRHSDDGIAGSTLQGGKTTQSVAQRSPTEHAFCTRCGAWRGELGAEPSIDLYLAHMLEVFAEVHRVLRKDGTLWLNLGDCYATGAGKVGDCPGGGEQGDRWKGYRGTRGGSPKHADRAMGPMTQPNRMPLPGLKPKDLIGIPWMVAFALRADGWWLRSEVIWAKPNGMPESVTDRPTKSHEHLFLLAKSQRYFYDAEAIKEGESLNPVSYARRRRADNGATGTKALHGTPWGQSGNGTRAAAGGRNRRSVWTIPTEPYPEAHFAVYPPDLVKHCLLSSTSAEGVCAACGAPWGRVVEKETRPNRSANRGKHDGAIYRTVSGGVWNDARERRELGWAPSCQCSAPTVPALILDPFAGSGTTGAVAQALRRRAVLIDLNPDYCEMAKKRISGVTPALDLVL